MKESNIYSFGMNALISMDVDVGQLPHTRETRLLYEKLEEVLHFPFTNPLHKSWWRQIFSREYKVSLSSEEIAIIKKATLEDGEPPDKTTCSDGAQVIREMKSQGIW